MTEPVRRAVTVDGATLRAGGRVIGQVVNWVPREAGSAHRIDRPWADEVFAYESPIHGAAPTSFKLTIPIGQMKVNLGFMFDQARSAGQPFEPGEWWKMCTCPGGHVCRHCGERTRSWCNVLNTCPWCGCPNGYEPGAVAVHGAPGMPDDRYGDAMRLSQGAQRAGDLEHVFGAAVEWVCRFPYDGSGEDRRLTCGWEEDPSIYPEVDEYGAEYTGPFPGGHQMGDIGP